MSTTKFFTPVVFFSVVLISCSNNKTKISATNNNETAAIPGAAAATTVEAIDLPTYSNAWQQSVTQTYTATSKKVSVLRGKKGLKIIVDPAALETEEGGPVDGIITVKMVELTNSEELFKSNATTISNGKLLVSGGSYFVSMECNGQQLRIKNRHRLQMEFPRLQDNEMELFYGNRNVTGSMNWERAGESLSFDRTMKYASYNPPYPNVITKERFKSKYRMYSSLNDKVFFEDKLTTIKNMVAILQKRGIDKNIDTLRIPLYDFYGNMIYDANFHYDTVVRYRILSCVQAESEKDSIAKSDSIFKHHNQANLGYYEEWQKENYSNSLPGQLQQYYSPSDITQLGWINCDRFYNSPQNIEVPVEIPYTFNDPDIEYFLIYKSFNGLVSGRILKNDKQQYVLSKLPQGQTVTFIAFTKSNGQVYQCKEEFVIQSNKILKPEFKTISEEELSKIFGRSVKI